MSFLRSAFFKLPSYARFEHKPIYYDQEKEEREANKARGLTKGVFKNKAANGSLSEDDQFFDKSNVNNGQMLRIVSLIGIMLSTTCYLIGFLPFLFSIIILMVCLLMFLRSLKRVR